METEARPRNLDRGAINLFGDSGMKILPWTKQILVVLWEQLRFVLHFLYYSFISVFQMFRFEVHLRITEDTGPRIQHISTPGNSADNFFLSSLFDNNKSMIVSGSSPLSKLSSELNNHTGSLLSSLVSDELCCSLVDDFVSRAAEGFSDAEDLGQHASWKLGCPGEWNVFVGSEDSGSGSDIFYSCNSSEGQVFNWEERTGGEDVSVTYDPYGPLNFAASLFGYSSRENTEPIDISRWGLKVESSVEHNPGLFCSNRGAPSDSESSWGHSDGSSADGDREESEKLWDLFTNCSDPYHPLYFTASALSSSKPCKKHPEVTPKVNATQDPPSPVETESTSPSSEDEEEALWQSLCHNDDPYHPLHFKACLTTASSDRTSRDSKVNSVNKRHVTVLRESSPDSPSPTSDGDPTAMWMMRRSRKGRLLQERRFKQHRCTASSPDKPVFVPWKRRLKHSGGKMQDDRPALKKVQFSPEVQVHMMRTWTFALQASRKGHWEELARDRDRFRRRIQEVEQAIGYCLTLSYRERVFLCRQKHGSHRKW